MTSPLVSVVMPTHERPALLDRAARSVLDQAGVEVELVVVDDASADDTAEATARLAEDPRVVVVRNERSLGPSGARNAGIARARGDFLAFVDDDDAVLPGALARLVGVLEADPGLGAVTPWYRVVHETTGRTVEFRGPVGYGAEQLLWFNFVGIPFVVLKRGAFADDIRFDPALPVSEDWDVWLRCAQERPFAVVPESLYSYHQHGGARVTKVAADVRTGFGAFLEKHRSEMTPACRTYHEAVIASHDGGRSAISRVLASAGRHAPVAAALAGTVLGAGYAASAIGTRRGDPGLPSRVMYRLLTSPARHPVGSR
jgi:glycosyltransferase involved in cell wall biosynthesis